MISRPVSLIVKHLSYTQEAGRRWRNTGANPVRGTLSGLVAQWSEQSAHNRLVVGSNPTGPIFSGMIAQSVEQYPFKVLVLGSSPSHSKLNTI